MAKRTAPKSPAAKRAPRKASAPQGAKPGAAGADPRLPHRYTDDGIDERNERLAREGRLAEGPSVAVRSRDAKAEAIASDIQQGRRRAAPRGDVPDMSADMRERLDRIEDKYQGESVEPWMVADPLAEVAQRHRRPGMVQRFVTEDTLDKRGKRGFELVRDQAGNVPRVGRLLLAEMPEAMAKRRNAHFRGEAERQLKDMLPANQERLQQVADASGERGLGVLKAGDTLSEHSMGSSSNEPGYAPDRARTVGVTRHGQALARE